MMAPRWAAFIAVAVLGCAGRVEPRLTPVACEAGTRRWALDASGGTRDLRVWIDASAQSFDGWGPYGRRRLRFAMEEWNSIKLPIRLVEARSLRESDIIVDVIEAIPGQGQQDRDQAGVTSLTHEGTNIVRARVYVAISAPFGVRYGVADQVANLMHELGHALGLVHTAESGALMAARRYAAELTGADIALARRHFACVPGS
jgi:hypothetical protein